VDAEARLDVDAVFCISLREREDRRVELQAELEPLGLDIEFYLADRDDGNPERGCYTSHQACARLALERGYRRVLMLEDDARLEHHDPRQIAAINAFLGWRNPELFYLGGIVGRMWRIPWPYIVRCRLAATHAYILSAKGCRKLCAIAYADKPIDSMYAKRFKAYGAYPLLLEQQPETWMPSDIARQRGDQPERQAVAKDEAFWVANRQRQHESVRNNFGRTLLLRWF
jgi:glycosyl transferase family 25